MKTQADLLRQQLALIQEQSRTAPTQPLVFPPELIARVVLFVRQQAQHGQSLAQCSQQLGVPRTRLHYWVYKRPKSPAAAPAPSLLRPVHVSPPAAPEADRAAERLYTLRSPSGWELSGLLFSELVQLLGTRL